MVRSFRVPPTRVFPIPAPSAAPRAARGRGGLLAGVAAAAMAAALAAPPPAAAGPSGGQVKGGQATIVTRGDVTVVRQGSRRLIIDWTSFDIGADEAVKFLQPGRSSVALNRVLDGLPTHIRGKLTANGNVWLVNQSGVMFHKGSVVDVGGLIATTADIDDAAFMAGGGTFDKPGEPGAAVVNEGTITFAEAGMVGLVAPEVANRGVIAGKLGKIVVAGQESFSVDVSGDGLFEIDLKDAAKTKGARAENSGLLISEGGTVIITAAAARDAVEAAVSMGGVIEAKSARVDGGTIVLDGGAGDVVVSGTLDASGGDGARGGRVDVTGGTVRLARGARIDVSGGTGGGTARIGGGAHGAGPAQGGLRAAEVVAMEAGATIDADARIEGDGGEVVLWSSAATWMGGRIEARGGELGGDGGFAEISSAAALGFHGIVDLAAPAGAPGLLLLDPRDVRIVADGMGGSVLTGPIFADDAAGLDLTIAASSLSASVADVRIEATRDISVEAAVSNRRSTVDMTLSAGRDILLSASLQLRGDLTLIADADFASQPADGTGAIKVLNALTLESSFGALSLAAPGGIDGGAMALGDVLLLKTNEGLTLPETDLAGGLALDVLGPAMLAGLDAHTLTANALSFEAAGAVHVDAAAEITTRGGDITAVSGGNVFRGEVTLDTSGGGLFAPASVSILSQLGLRLDGLVADKVRALSPRGNIDQTGPVFVSGDSTLIARAIDLSLLDNLFGGPVAMLTQGTAALGAAGDVTLSTVFANRLELVSMGEIRQAAGSAAVVNSSTTVATDGGAVRLESPTNRFGGRVSVDTSLLGASPADVVLAATGDLTLGGTRARDLEATATGALAQLAPLTVEGAATLSGAAITFDMAGNRFGGAVSAASVGDVSLHAAQDLLLGDVSATGLSLVAAGDLGQLAGAGLVATGATAIRSAGGDVALGETTNLFGGPVSVDAPGDVTLGAAGDLEIAGATADLLRLDVAGALTQSGALLLGAGLEAEAASVDFSNPANDLGALASVSTPGAALLRDAGDLVLGDVTAASLEVVAAGAVGQGAGASLDVAGLTMVRTAGGAATLGAAGNRFGGAVSVDTTDTGAAAADVTLGATGDLVLAGVIADRLSVEATGALTQTGALSLIAGGDLAAGSFTLLDLANDFGAELSLQGGAARLATGGGVRFGASSLASLELSAGDDVGQGGAIAVSGTTRIETPGDVILTAANAFDGAVSISGDAVAVTDADALTLVSVEAGSTLEAMALGGDLSMARVRVGGGAGALTGGADGGSIFLASVLAGDTVLGGATGAAAQDVTVEAASLGSLNVAASGGGALNGVRLAEVVLAGDLGVAGAPNLTLDGVALATDAGFDPGDVTGVLTLHRVRAAGDLTASVAGDIRLGLVELTAGAKGAGDLSLTSTGGSILKLADAAIDFGAAAAGGGEVTILLPDGSQTTVASVALAPYADLLATAGDLKLAAAGDLLLPQAEAGTSARAAASGLRVRVGGAADLAAGGGLALSHAGDLTLAALAVGGDAAIQVLADGDAGGLGQSGAASVAGTLTLDVAGDATLDRADNALGALSGRIGGALAARDADGFAVADLRAASLSVAGQAGDVTLRDVATAGDLTVEAGRVSARRIASGAEVALTATLGAAQAQDVQAAGALAMQSAGDLTLARVSAASLDLVSGGALSLRDGAAGDLLALSDGDATLANLRLGTAQVEAEGAISALGIAADALSLDAVGAIALGGVSATGDLSAVSLDRIATVDDAPAELSAVTIAGVRGATVGVETQARLGDATPGRQQLSLAAGPDLALGAQATTDMVGVGGEAVFAAANGIDLRGEDAPAGGLQNRFDGTLMLTSGGSARVEAAGGLTFGATTVLGDLFARSNADGADLAGGAGIDQRGALQVQGLARFVTGSGDAPAGAELGDVTLDLAGNGFATLEVVARDATLRDADGFALANTTLSGRLTVGGGGVAQAGDVTLSAVSADGGAFVLAAGDVDGVDVALRADSGFASRTGAVSLADVASTARVEATAATDLAVSDSFMAALAAQAGGNLALDAVRARSVAATAGGALSATGGAFDAATLAADKALSIAGGAHGDVAATAGGAASVSGGTFASLDLTSGGDAALGLVSAQDLSVEAGGNGLLDEVAARTAQVSVAGDLGVMGGALRTASLVAGGSLSLIVGVHGDVTAQAATSAEVVGAGFASLGLTAGGDASLSRVTSTDLSVDAGGNARLVEVQTNTLVALAGTDLSTTGGAFGTAALTAGGALVLQGGAHGDVTAAAGSSASVADARFASLDLAAGVDAAGDAALEDVTAQTATVAAGRALSLTGGALQTASLTSLGAMSVAGGSHGTVAATAGASADLRDANFGSLDLTAGAGVALLRVAAEDLAVAGAASGALEDVSALDATVEVVGDLGVIGGALEMASLSAGGDFSLSGGMHGVVTARSGGAASLADADFAALDLTAGTDAALARIGAGDLAVLAGGNAGLDAVTAARASVEAGGDLDLTGGALEAATLVSGGAFRLAGGTHGDVTARAGTTAALTDAAFGSLDLVAGGNAALTRLTARALTAAGSADVALTAVEATDAAVSADGDLGLAGGALQTASLTAGGGLSIEGGAHGDVTARAGQGASVAGTAFASLALEAGGAASLETVTVAGALGLVAGGDAALSGVTADTLDADASGAMSWTDVGARIAGGRAGGDFALLRVAADEATLSGDAASVDASDFGTLALAALRAARLTDVTMDAGAVDAGGDADLTRIEAGTLDVDAGGGISLREVAAGSLDARAGLAMSWTSVSVDGAAVGVARGGGAVLSEVEAQTAEISARGDVSVTDASFERFDLIALGDALLTNVAAGDLAVAAGVDFGGGEGRRTASVSEGEGIGEGSAILANVTSADATLSATADVIATDSELTRVSALAGRDGIFARVRGDALDLTAGRDLSWTDLSFATAAGVATTGDAQLSRVSLGAASVTAGRDLGVADSRFTSLAAEAGRSAALARSAGASLDVAALGDLTVRDVEAGELALDAGGAMTALRVAAQSGALTAGGALSATDLSGGQGVLSSGAATTLTRVALDQLEATSGGAMTVADLTHGRAVLDAGGGLSVARAEGDVLLATAGGAATLTDLSAMRIEAAADGDLTGTRLWTEKAMTLSGKGVTLLDLAAGGDVSVAARAGLDVRKLAGGGDATLSAGDAATLTQVAAAGLLRASADLDGSADAPALKLRTVEAGRLVADAGGQIDLDGVATGADASLRARSGDLLLGSLSVGGALTAQANGGSIRTKVGAASTAGWSVAGASGPASPASPTGLPSGETGESLGAPLEVSIAAGAAEVAARAYSDLLRVEGDAVFDAAGSVLLPGEFNGRNNDFRGGVTVSRARHAAISDRNDLRIGAAETTLPDGGTAQGGLYNRVDGERLATIHIEAGGDVTDAAGAKIRTAGDAWVVAGRDVRLNSGRHDFGGAFAARAGDVEVAVRGDLRLGPIQASGTLMALAGSSGDYASITQTTSARVTKLGMENGRAADGMIDLSGPIRVNGDADFATGADPHAPASDQGADLTLDAGTNVFGGDVAIRRIFGDVTLIEESAPGALRVDAHDAGWLRFAEFDAGGDVLIRTSDNVLFMGRTTGLTDDMDPDGPLLPPSAASADAWIEQGGKGVKRADLRLFIRDGTVFAIDTTAGGADGQGGQVRFDRPIDGANALSSAREPDAAAGRDGAGALEIDAGPGGDVRFRDYVGAANPIGAVTIVDARNVSLGHTFAQRDARPDDDPDRFLLRGKGQSVDIFTSGPIVIDARGAVEIYMPAGLLEEYETNDDYFGLNTPGLTYGENIEPDSLSLFGYIGDSGQKAAGLYPVGPKGVDYLLNGCVIGDVQDCTGVSPPRILNIVTVDQPEILNVEEEDLLELFVSYGNEELWGVPDGYFDDSDLARARAEANRQAAGDDDEDDEEEEDQAAAQGGVQVGGTDR
ncbi:filamentous hemagglutinin N-terminal domain-containing protein [Albimonas sp. CAU 1670]|uniref:two-partner secretion domain-containing protein n=1 Tax=Albimonas sp. CAU 1670 TaxID=3032599 RepID=UPI0023DBC198|nr:filamentous hemagglutinin N-terminal domain-containing protein [Albimonas sp. CAU 1670]MDF2233107.1 filamentous hemagglutinin N-terminal domain-containing protein [Albimonas sp. CAU 1670]